ncbi:hypothetical protein LCGC14_0395530 [marine sediment metagenome]|uniref:Uncharacterized protein n=1 Tax=marine sediment metagenome TaxID=412755 RepID=A0A0F9TGF3_9ZZZZ
MNRRTFLSLLPSIPLIPRLLGEDDPWALQPYVDWRDTMTATAPVKYSTSLISYPEFQNLLRACRTIEAKQWIDKHFPEMIKEKK